MQVDLYELTRDPVERILLRIAERVTGQGGRLLVVAADETLARRIDSFLWDHDPAAFVPHGRAGGAGETRQPILIADDVVPTNEAKSVALADGIWREAALGFERAFHFFDEATVDAARAAWRTLKDREGVTRNFWRQDGGKWVKVA
ncbi:DNA polymerase III subunit chi [Sphingomonas naphthae]|uniref:DNA polymerase III subunit chi n=1 Tax=Sphingomonas naphthae TaxID=1813468 RepID=A0ABY7TPQ4_9SPHN|nr:DNA polymerase III subunit chi [Sphingomonas naphthae]WCT75217.1 DNA polymerase III subunit chi [Sphingomonas naphthae]